MVDEISTFTFYAKFYGIEEDGTLTKDWCKEEGARRRGAFNADDERDEDEEQCPRTVADASTYASKPALMAFCTGLMFNKYDPVLTRIVQNQKGQGSVLTLDLTVQNLITITIKNIARDYQKDFAPAIPDVKVAEVPKVTNTITAVAQVLTATPSIASKSEYDARLAQWEEKMRVENDNALEAFISARIVYVVSQGLTVE